MSLFFIMRDLIVTVTSGTSLIVLQKFIKAEYGDNKTFFAEHRMITKQWKIHFMSQTQLIND